jgi:hypothetical protein
MFGNPGGAVGADLAMEAFEDDVKVTSRSVSWCGSSRLGLRRIVRAGLGRWLSVRSP